MSSPNFMEFAAAAAKGDLSTTYLEGGDAGRGILPASVAEEFIQMFALESDFLQEMNLQTMRAPEHYLDVAGFNGRVARKDVPGVATTEDQRSSLTISREPLDAKWFRAASFLNYHVLAENIMGPRLGEFVQRDLTRQSSFDQDETMISGDTDSATDGLDRYDGVLKQALSYTIDSSGSPAAVQDQIFYDLFQSMPKRGRRNKKEMLYCCSDSVEAAYAQWLTSNRGYTTASYYEHKDPGDRIKYQGIRVKPFAAWPDTHVMLVDRRNCCPGIFIGMFLERFRDIDAGVDKYILRWASDIAFAEPELVRVWYGINLGVSASL